MLEIRDLHSFYGEAHVVQGASLTVRDGEVVALLGRNGMGKTSLIRSVMGLSAPQVRQGSVAWKGEVLTGMKSHEIAGRKIALVPQGRRLFPSLTVTEHLTMIKSARARNGWTVDRVMELFPRLAERRQHRGNQLSGGERQMLAVARALMIDPELILMDEPSEGLAPVMVQHLEGIIARLKEAGLAILLVEQNLYSALAVADRVYVIETGKIVHEADASALVDNPQSLIRFLGVH
ncbi:ABC transporter ATP-binding protein [Bradyrhizobium sacchari]|uniref:Amino acid/amide ABC transporter ATP-binding protein 2 (HAAT family) n=1 Tax=Bradyrhizobium sacchari TaxID=1399419 RepID=A0A560JWX5_9BRAD|nr:ABC transporter ATP-binding protein [Bradyrhizobium sacchari]OPY97044.1 ABC transporter ATP-binding protein [Bradyrhizobium sacchari]TWB58790.1 amino acid/amide ABC transporter ATP-binding protein 2 (HAAT family) [Bradyrhizobium sacchari]TWB72850.1 amino acid/amide ABC transporter ATP-binding protein 2 (HAAT family) [Bradyrhizobium sacchari]